MRVGVLRAVRFSTDISWTHPLDSSSGHVHTELYGGMSGSLSRFPPSHTLARWGTTRWGTSR